MTEKQVDEQFMQHALDLAKKGRGTTSPNPMVGAVVVKRGKIMGEGYHQIAGGPHAEIIALKQAGKNSKGADIYVTLEPCSHYGKTGPCTEAIIEAGIKRVVYAVQDPNPVVKGNGARRLKKSGIVVVGDLLKAEATELNEAYFHYHAAKRPFVILKTAQTLDGYIATRNGESQWITGTEARKQTHMLRSEVDAVIVGAGTVRTDDPKLTVRAVKGRNPYRIVLTESGNIPTHAALLAENSDMKTIVATSETGAKKLHTAAEKANLILWKIAQRKQGGLDLSDFLTKAGEFGMRSLLLEGGATLATSFWKAGLVDKYIAMIAPSILGTGMPVIGDLGISRLDKRVELSRMSVSKAGTDYLFSSYPVWSRS
jgi:diaminohydroxyphosphoribosylaminopyrimidine deaminase/5-amino-6-(5-phosphoribosylamino)uracil reductase